jgi:sugar/nucleoside kinase (ribokinase family)
MTGPSILVVGSVAYDSVASPQGERTEQLGGTGVFSSVASGYLTCPGIVGVVGTDFKDEDVAMLQDHGVDISGLEVADGNTFRWAGSYVDDLNVAVTLDTQLNVFETFNPTLCSDHAVTPYLFLGNIDPDLQLSVLNQMSPRPRVVACDTMNLWIDIKREPLTQLIDQVDVLLINEAEAEQFTGETSIVNSAISLLAHGLKLLIIKRGEYGAAVFHGSFSFAVPAYPMAKVVDPTGAGDSFAGGFMGYLAAVGSGVDDEDTEAIRRAAVVGSVMASFAVEDFGVERLRTVTHTEINERFTDFVNLTRFHPLGGGQGLPTP